MKNQFSKNTANAVKTKQETVKNENGTENQNTETATVTETPTENGTPTTPTESGTPTTATATTEHTTTATAETTTTATETTEHTTTTTATATAETFEELQKRLDVELTKLNFKKKLALHRETFINSMGSLQLYINELANENEFETKSGKITFKILETDKYDRTNYIDTFTVSNTDLIRKFCNLLYSEMNDKKTELETQLLTA